MPQSTKPAAALVLAATIIGAFVLIDLSPAAPGTLNPPTGPVQGTGRTLDEIYDRIDDIPAALSESTNEAIAGRQLLYSNNGSFNIPGPGRIILHSMTISDGSVQVRDGNNDLILRITSQPSRTPSNDVQYFGNNQLLLDVIVDLPLQGVATPGINQGASGVTVIYTLLPE